LFQQTEKRKLSYRHSATKTEEGKEGKETSQREEGTRGDGGDKGP
jgi:hypothetical protein